MGVDKVSMEWSGQQGSGVGSAGHQDDDIMTGLRWLQLHQCDGTVLRCDAATPPP